MAKLKNILIVGLGAIGSIYATKFLSVGSLCLRVLADVSRVEKYRQDGLIFNNIRYDFDYILPDEKDFKADLVLIAVKARDLDKVISDIEPFVCDGTIIMSLLNGITSEDLIAQKYGWDKLLYSFYIGHASMRKGNEITYDGIGKVVFGEAENENFSDKVLAIKDLFDIACVEYEIPSDMLCEMWKKYTINIGINQASAALGADYGVLQTSNKARALAKGLMEEAVNVAKTIGIKNTDGFIDAAFDLIDSMPCDLKPSMLQDVEAKRHTEIGILGVALCKMAKRYNIPTPENEMVCDKIASFVKIT